MPLIRLAFAAAFSAFAVSAATGTPLATGYPVILKCVYTESLQHWRDMSPKTIYERPGVRYYRISPTEIGTYSTETDDKDWSSDPCDDTCTVSTNSFSKAFFDSDETDNIGVVTMHYRRQSKWTISRADGAYAYEDRRDAYRYDVGDGTSIKLGAGERFKVKTRKGTCQPAADPLGGAKAF